MIMQQTKRLLINIYRNYLVYPIIIFYLNLRKPKDNEIYVFHHIPKTAGTSFNAFLKSHFILFKDYKMGWSNRIPKAICIKGFDSRVCVSGHYDFYEGCSPNIHYSDQLKGYNKKFKKIVFLRDPFDLRVSLFKYLMLNNQIPSDQSLESFLFQEVNFISKSLVCNEKNYEDVLDSYFFVGLSEYYDKSMAKLSSLLKLDYKNSKRKNVSKKRLLIDQNLKNKFKKMNLLDYKIYDYAIYKFNQS